MELTYMVRGGDSKEYGPVTLGQLTNWVREGRLTPQQEVKRSDMEHWAAAGSFSELQPLFSYGNPTNPAAGIPATTAPMTQTGQTDPAAYAQMKSGASWFYWIAGLSLINSISSFSGAGFRFFFGLGITQRMEMEMGRASALVLGLIAAGLFILFGVFGHKAQTWAFVVGMLLFALDTLLLVAFQAWLGVALHAFALFCLFRGFVACRKVTASLRV